MNERVFIVEADRQRAHLLAFLSRQPFPFQVALGPIRERRSLSANARLWLLHTAASEVTGYTPEEAHEEMLCAHFGYTEKERVSPWTGEIEIRRIPNKRSSTRDKNEFSRFMDFVENFYGEKLGVWLPNDRAQ